MPLRFNPGSLYITPGASAAIEASGETPLAYLARHLSGDWGEVGPEDWQENEFSLEHGFRLLSAYRLRSGERIWVITEATRESTTILLPNEYQKPKLIRRLFPRLRSIVGFALHLAVRCVSLSALVPRLDVIAFHIIDYLWLDCG
jgi:hypothetical protein